MTTRISRDFEFLAGVHFESNFIMNSYSITLSMDVETDSIKEQNIAMDRMKFFIHEMLDSAVFVEDSETKIIEKYQNAGIKVCTTPEEPYDQIITMLLFYKLNAITEGRLHIDHIQLDSVLSDGVGFLWEDESISIPYGPGWWSDSSINIADKLPSNKKEKIVKLVKKSDWATLGLDWKEKNSAHTEIIFTPETEK